MKCIITFQFPLKHHISISQLIQWLRVFGCWLKSGISLLIGLEIISYMNIDLNIALYKPSEGTNQYITLSDDIISHHHTCLLITDKSNNCWLQCLRRKWAVFINCVQGHFSVDSILVLTQIRRRSKFKKNWVSLKARVCLCFSRDNLGQYLWRGRLTTRPLVRLHNPGGILFSRPNWTSTSSDTN